MTNWHVQPRLDVHSAIHNRGYWYYRFELIVWGSEMVNHQSQYYRLIAIPCPRRPDGQIALTQESILEWLEHIHPAAKEEILFIGGLLPKAKKETPEEWRERNLKAKNEQIEHDICASEMALERHIEKLIRLKKIRDAAIQKHPDLKDSIETAFGIYHTNGNQEVPDDLDQDEAYA